MRVFRRCMVPLAMLAVISAGPLVFAQSQTAPAANQGNAAALAANDAADRYMWLEDVSTPRSMAWVKAENARTAAVLEADPHYKPFFDEALKIESDPARLPLPSLGTGDEIYNQWRDASNPRGLLRKTTLADYLTPTPHWTPVIDYDALGRAEHAGWVPRGLSCLYPGDQYCMVSLSDGGEDAVTEREFDRKSSHFVPSGFQLPHSKQGTAWVDKDTLLVWRDWGAGTMTHSGYAFVVKEWKRGTPLESAREIFRGAASDETGSSGVVFHDAQGESLTILHRGVTFFSSQTAVRTSRGVEALAIPAKAGIAGLLRGRVLISTEEAWTPTPGGQTFPAGSLLQVSLPELLADPAHLKPSAVFTPTPQEFMEGHALTRDCLIVTTLRHVQGQAYIYTPPAGDSSAAWSQKALPLPENVAVGIVSAANQDNRFFLDVTSFLRPSAVWLGDAAAGTLREAKSQPAQFDASRDTVEQFEATSKDGTRVPYFVVHPRDMKLNGANPTLLTAYGGFQVAETPYYSRMTGKLWLERGGVYVLANIRGGGEFGPAWHEAGLNIHRQRIYDDFAAVGEDLVARHITSPRHLGIEGGSNGGLLMGVEMEQHPALWNAVVIQVPLLDMIRFEHIAAGASWVGEYGSPSNPEQYAFLQTISPYQNLRPGVHYPTPLIFTTTKDDRVGPQHARKFAAKMEEFHLPFFYDEITEGGHGSGADLKQQAGTYALTFTYLTRQLTSQ